MLAIVMELCGKGSLFKLIKKAREVSQLPHEVLSNAVQPRNARERELKAHYPFPCSNDPHPTDPSLP